MTRQILKEFILSDDFKRKYPDLKKLINSPEDLTARSNVSGALLSAFIKKHKGWTGNAFRNDVRGERERRCFNVYLIPLLDSMVKELTEKEKAAQRIDENALLSDDQIETSLEHYLKGENDGNMLYVDMITNIIKMGNFGGGGILINNDNILKVFGLEKVRSALTEAIVPALHPVRASLGGVTMLTVDGLRTKYLNDDYIKNLISPKTLAGLKVKKERKQVEIADIEKLNRALEKGNPKLLENDLKLANLQIKIGEIEQEMQEVQEQLDREPERQLEIGRRYEDGLATTTSMLYDLIEFSVKNATGNGIINGIVNFVHGRANPNPEYMLQAIKDFYKKFFDNSDLNEALLVNVTEKALDLVEEKEQKRLEHLEAFIES